MSGTVTTDFSDTVAQGSIVTHTVFSIAMAMPDNVLPECDEDSESVTRKLNRRISFILRPRDKFI